MFNRRTDRTLLIIAKTLWVIARIAFRIYVRQYPKAKVGLLDQTLVSIGKDISSITEELK